MTLDQLFEYLFDAELIYPDTGISIYIYDDPFDVACVAYGNYYQSQIQAYNRRYVVKFTLDINDNSLEVLVEGSLIV